MLELVQASAKQNPRFQIRPRLAPIRLSTGSPGPHALLQVYYRVFGAFGVIIIR